MILNSHAIAEVTTKNVNTEEGLYSELANFFLENVVALEAEALKEMNEKLIQDVYKKTYMKRFASLKLSYPIGPEFYIAEYLSKEVVANNVISGINTIQLTDVSGIFSERPLFGTSY
ncbi:hypothetical protein WAE56_20200 [Iodobacter sp. LRB]|uniref:hypothetical protein n=1 Tax=unclassified Iodobacter TaxID=235634 RepID=UPI000C0F76C6|nr:hypothetical protein [Iodobacter sp. BJB302]PHU99635.1 hypothetical protein CSQ88_21425 [Iodobacter sp. BJB302]